MKSILIIEDNQETLELLELVLQLAGYATLAASSAEQGLELHQEHAVDLILTDLCMPETSGFDVIKILRAKNPGTKIIVMSGDCMPQPDQEDSLASALGVLKTFPKPFVPQELVGYINGVLADPRP